MSHELDITNGVAAFADSRTRNGQVDAWHRLGTPVGHSMTPEEALEAAHLAGWNVRTLPLLANLAEEGSDMIDSMMAASVRVPGRNVVIRTNPVSKAVEPMGVVGDRWHPIQNEEAASLLYDITDATGAHIETAGALDGGRRVFLTMKLPNHVELTAPTGFRDVTDMYLAVTNRHDGGGALLGMVTPVRIVCANTQRIAEGAAVSRMTLWHTGNAQRKLAEVRELLGLTMRYQDTYAAEMEAMSVKYREDEWVRGVLNDVFAVDKAETEQQRTLRTNRAAAVMEVYRTSDTVDMWRGTAFGGFNALTEWVDHYSPVQGKDGHYRRAVRAVTPGSDGERIKELAFAGFSKND